MADEAGACDIRALRRDRLAAVLIVLGLAPTIPFIIASSRLDEPASACEYPLYAQGSGALALMWALFLLIWLIFTRSKPAPPLVRLGLMCTMIGCIIFASFNFDSYVKEDRCKLRYSYPSGYRTYSSVNHNYTWDANRLAWGLPSDSQTFFTNTHVGVNSMLLVYGVFPISGATFWLIFACCLLYPHLLLYGLWSKTTTLAHLEWRTKHIIMGHWLAIEDDDEPAPSVKLLERYPPPTRRIPTAIPLLITYLGVGIPAIIRLVTLSDPIRYAKLGCNYPIWQGAFALLIGMTFMFMFYWAALTARRPSMLRSSLAHFTSLGMLIFSIWNMAWYDQEGSCKSTYLSPCTYSYSEPCHFTDDQNSLTSIHIGLSVAVFLWTLLPLTFWLSWAAVLCLLVAPAAGLWVILSRSSAGCGKTMEAVALCFWRQEDEDDWDEDLEPSVLAARQARDATAAQLASGSAPASAAAPTIAVVIPNGGVDGIPMSDTSSSLIHGEHKESARDRSDREYRETQQREARARDQRLLAERRRASEREQAQQQRDGITARERAAEERERQRIIREQARNEIRAERAERERKKADDANKRAAEEAEVLRAKNQAIPLPQPVGAGRMSITIPVAGPSRIVDASAIAPPPAYAPGALVPPGGVALDHAAPPPYDPSSPPAAAAVAPPVISSIEEMAFCGSCGTQRFDRVDRFCRKCGTPIIN